MKKNYDYVLQQNSYDCGIASLITILMYYGIKPSRESIVSKLNKKHGGYTAYDLVKVSKSYGLDAYGIKSNIKDIKKLPVIAHTIKDKNLFHFIVILEKNKDTLKVMDPSIGIIDITYEEFSKITTNIFLIFEGLKRKKAKDLRFKREIFGIFKQNKKIIVKTLFLSIIYVGICLLFNYYLSLIISNKGDFDLLNIILLVFLNISLLKNFISYIRNNLILNLNNKIDKEVTFKLTNHILNLPYEYFISKTTGELVTILEDIENFKEIITKVFILSLVDLILIGIVLIYVSFINLHIALLMLLVIVFILLVTKRYQYSFNDSYLKYKNLKINYSSNLISYITSFETIKNLNISSFVEKLLTDKYNDSLKEDKIYNKKYYNYNLITSLIMDIFYLLVIYISAVIFLNNNGNSINIILFSSIFYMIIGFLSNITESISLYKVYQTSTDRVLDCLEVKKEENSKTNYSLINNISFKNVGYIKNEQTVLKNINLNIRKSEKVYITGESGTGKSSLMKLLLKYFSINEGNILIDDIDIKDIDLSFIRDHVTYIGQNEELFTGTIMDNLKMVSDDFKKIKKVSSITMFDEVLSSSNIDYNYPLEESGYNLSGGERKKLILTRGLLKFKSVLILDEVFNEISIEEERKILKNIFDNYKDKIIIVISHRSSNKDLFDKKFELKREDGINEIK